MPQERASSPRFKGGGVVFYVGGGVFGCVWGVWGGVLVLFFGVCFFVGKDLPTKQQCIELLRPAWRYAGWPRRGGRSTTPKSERGLKRILV